MVEEHTMLPDPGFRSKPPEFWAGVKLVSQLLGYSSRATRDAGSRVRIYTPFEVVSALQGRGLYSDAQSALADEVAQYSSLRAEILEGQVKGNLMDRDEASLLFEQLRDEIQPTDALLPMNKQRGPKRHYLYLTGIVNMLTYRSLETHFGEAIFDWDPRGPLTFARDGMPLRTLFRRMDGAYPSINHPYAAWEIKEYYGTTTFGSRVADGVYESALDGFELDDLRRAGVDVKHFLFVDDRYTWWECGRSYLCRIIDMLHVGLLDGAYFGREVVAAWPAEIAGWPRVADSPG